MKRVFVIILLFWSGVVFADEAEFGQLKFLAGEGDARSQKLLGDAYIAGDGTGQNKIYGLMWLYIASVNGANNAIEARNALVDTMNWDDVQIAYELARTCYLSDYKECG